MKFEMFMSKIDIIEYSKNNYVFCFLLPKRAFAKALQSERR
jgi:hypothetical protein